MREVGAFEAKNKLAALLDEVERGEEVTITRRGQARGASCRPRSNRRPRLVRSRLDGESIMSHYESVVVGAGPPGTDRQSRGR